MSSVIGLDPNAVSELEPFESSEGTVTMLSPWAVPARVELSNEGPDVLLLFEYADKEAAGSRSEMLDAEHPPVRLSIGVDTRRVESVRLPVSSLTRIEAVAGRLDRAAESKQLAVGRRLSYRMTAAVLRLIAQDLRL